MNDRSESAVSVGGVPSPETVRAMVERGQPAVFPLAAAVSVEEAHEAAKTLARSLARDDLLVIASPPARGQSASLNVLQLVDEVEARRWRGELERLVAEFRAVASGLIEQFRLHVEPAYELGEPYQDELGIDEQRWWLHIHGEHCRFESLADGVVLEVNIERPDVIDAYFLLLFAETSDRYPGVCSACLYGIHDMSRMLTLAAFD